MNWLPAVASWGICILIGCPGFDCRLVASHPNPRRLHSEDQARKKRDHPHHPDEDAQPMKPDNCSLVAAYEYNCGPHCMSEHQEDGSDTSDTVHTQRKHARYAAHQRRARRISRKADPKEDQVPSLQLPGKLLTPHADRVAEQRGNHKDD